MTAAIQEILKITTVYYVQHLPLNLKAQVKILFAKKIYKLLKNFFKECKPRLDQQSWKKQKNIVEKNLPSEKINTIRSI